MTPEDFESLLDKVTEQLSNEVRASKQYHAPDVFEGRVKQVLTDVAHGQGIKINPTFHVHAFPDIQANGFGVEVKTTNKDSWQSVGNSVFEGMRDSSVKKIYVVFGKMGVFRRELLPLAVDKPLVSLVRISRELYEILLVNVFDALPDRRRTLDNKAL
jgi:hypothetical protein